MPQRTNVGGRRVGRRKFLQEPQVCIGGLIGTSRAFRALDFKDKAWAANGEFLRFSGEQCENDRTTSSSDGQENMGLVLSQALTSTLILKFAIGPLALW